MKLALIALLALSSTQALADARSIETADCTMTLNGSTSKTSFSLESLVSPKILAEGGAFVLQAKPLLKNPVMNDHWQDTVNPVGLEIMTVNGIIDGVHTINGGEGTSTIQALVPLSNGQLIEVQAACTISYVE